MSLNGTDNVCLGSEIQAEGDSFDAEMCCFQFMCERIMHIICRAEKQEDMMRKSTNIYISGSLIDGTFVLHLRYNPIWVLSALTLNMEDMF